MSDIKWNDDDLVNGLDGLLKDAVAYMSGSAERLNQKGKSIYKSQMKNNGKLYFSKNRNFGNEWFTPDNKKWYITNKWKIPNSVWSARNFVEQKKKQVSKSMKTYLGNEKQKELDTAINFAVSNF